VLALIGEFVRFWYDYDARMKVLEEQRAASESYEAKAKLRDSLQAYGWRLELASSELGGLKATVAPLAVVGPRPARAAADLVPHQ